MVLHIVIIIGLICDWSLAKKNHDKIRRESTYDYSWRITIASILDETLKTLFSMVNLRASDTAVRPVSKYTQYDVYSKAPVSALLRRPGIQTSKSTARFRFKRTMWAKSFQPFVITYLSSLTVSATSPARWRTVSFFFTFLIKAGRYFRWFETTASQWMAWKFRSTTSVL